MTPAGDRPSEQQEAVESGAGPRSGTEAAGTPGQESETPAPQFTPAGDEGTGRDRETDQVADPAGVEKPGDPEERAMRIENE
ncbi:hypothetical protein [Amycolatopsis palatopharyngis]|uniref:hypothetical protein n=1 Tax=Amycolatopsis palatopharyngis TaxID=187982 RepID=UPI000E23E2D5|nr:hypothetical protein [Amycolatopsis palatopharyngis]